MTAGRSPGQRGPKKGNTETGSKPASTTLPTGQWQQLVDIKEAKVMEHKALAAYAPTGRNLAKLHQAEQKAATLEHMYRDEKDPTEYSTRNKMSS